MKYISTLALVVALGVSAFGQTFNQETTLNDRSYVIGKFTKEKLETGTYAEWFTPNLEAYEPKSETIQFLKEALPEYTITLFMGTWCGDSRREVPRFYKILEDIDFPMERLTAVALHPGREQTKQSPGGEEQGLNIHRVPTFIVFKEGKEIGRIVEEPRVSIEADLAAILQGNYVENYHGVQLAIEAMDELGWQKFGQKRHKIAKRLEPELQHYIELHTYSRVLRAAGDIHEALEISKLNAEVFPDEPNVYFNLGTLFWEANQKVAAEIEFEKAIAKSDKKDELQQKIDFIKENYKPQF